MEARYVTKEGGQELPVFYEASFKELWRKKLILVL
jgi:hypothetical protein